MRWRLFAAMEKERRRPRSERSRFRGRNRWWEAWRREKANAAPKAVLQGRVKPMGSVEKGAGKETGPPLGAKTDPALRTAKTGRVARACRKCSSSSLVGRDGRMGLGGARGRVGKTHERNGLAGMEARDGRAKRWTSTWPATTCTRNERPSSRRTSNETWPS